MLVKSIFVKINKTYIDIVKTERYFLKNFYFITI